MRISPSQLALYSKCPLAWWRKHVRRLPEMRRRRKDGGSDAHALFADYLEHGTASDDPLLQRALPLLERPADTVIQVEVDLDELTSDPVHLMLAPEIQLVGRVDAIYFRRPLGATATSCTIVDHKTYGATGKKYLASGRPGTKHWLGDDVQMLTYAAALQRLGNYPEVTVRHNQIPTDPDTTDTPRAITATLDAERLQAHWKNLEAMAAIMSALRQETTSRIVGDVFESDPCRTCDFVGICAGSEDEEQYCRRAEQPERDDGDVFA